MVESLKANPAPERKWCWNRNGIGWLYSRSDRSSRRSSGTEPCSAWCRLMMSLMTIVLILVFALQQRVFAVDQLAILAKAPLMYFVQMSLLAAVAIFFSTFVSPLVNFFLSGGLFLVGSLFNTFFETLAGNDSTPQFAKALATAINTILPNFATYNVQNPIINPGQQIVSEFNYYLNATVYGVFYIGILLVGGILVFDRREV